MAVKGIRNEKSKGERERREGGRCSIRGASLRNKRNGPVSLNGLSVILNNPFYVGIIRVKQPRELFQGIHAPLVQKSVFDNVQRVLAGRAPLRMVLHDFLFRRLLTCANCNYSLIGERQKGHVYYRCHSVGCATKGVREEAAERTVIAVLEQLQLGPDEQEYLLSELSKIKGNWEKEREAQLNQVRLQLAQLQDRLSKLTDAYLDGVIDQPLFEDRKAALLASRAMAGETLRALDQSTMSPPDAVRAFLELLGSIASQYKSALPEEKRELIRVVTSNRAVKGKKVDLALSDPFGDALRARPCRYGVPYRGSPRTWKRLLTRLIRWFTLNPSGFNTASATLSAHHGREQKRNKAVRFAA